MSKWDWILDDLSGVAQGELTNCASRKLSFQLNGLPTASGQLQLDHVRAADVLGLACRLRVYRDDVLLFHGPVITAEENAQGAGGTVAFTAAGAQWRLVKRLIGKSLDSNNKGVGFAMGTAGAQLDLSGICQSIIDTTNADTSVTLAQRYTNIATNAAWTQASSNGFVGPWYFKPVSDALQEIAALLNGPDYEFIPVEARADAAGLTIAEFHAYAFKGGAKPNVIYEYGVGKRSMGGYKRQRSIDGLLNKGWSLPSGFPDVAVAGQVPVTNAYDTSASLATYGLFEDVVPGDLTVDALRQKLVDEHARIRSLPRELITFTAAPNAPYVFKTDFDIGDVVTARAVVNGIVRFNLTERVYGVSFSPDDKGNDNMDISVVPS